MQRLRVAKQSNDTSSPADPPDGGCLEVVQAVRNLEQLPYVGNEPFGEGAAHGSPVRKRGARDSGAPRKGREYGLGAVLDGPAEVAPDGQLGIWCRKVLYHFEVCGVQGDRQNPDEHVFG